jgi:hypothetical protein
MRYLIIILASLMLVGCGNFFNGKRYLAQAGPGKNPTSGQFGWSDISLDDAKLNALKNCEKSVESPLSGSWLLSVKPTCKVFAEYINPDHPENQEELKKLAEQKQKEAQQAKIISEQRKLENEYGRYITQCEYIGFKKNTDKMGECVLKLYQTEASIAASNSQKRAADSADTLTNLVILNESLKLMNPPRQNFNCQARPFGIYTNVYCN